MSEHSDGKFRVELLPGHTPLADDEPVFVFRGRDAFMAATLDYYADCCRAAGSPKAHVEAIYDAASAVRDWQQVYGNRVPD